MYCIVGQAGCGESALLLQTLPGELLVSEGHVRRNYTSLFVQDPWFMDTSVSENIIQVMGCNFYKDWYDNVVNAYGLDTEISVFLLGDGTIFLGRGRGTVCSVVAGRELGSGLREQYSSAVIPKYSCFMIHFPLPIVKWHGPYSIPLLESTP